MPKVINIPRYVAHGLTFEYVTPEKFAWISISEPDDETTIISNKKLDTLSKLKISFFDLETPVFDKRKNITLSPPTKKQVNKILKFIKENQGKNFIINCAAGVSRSGAICKFMEDVLEYKWPENAKAMALPNMTLYKMLVEQWNTWKDGNPVSKN